MRMRSICAKFGCGCSLEDQRIVLASLSYHRPLAMEVRNYCLPVESDLVATVAPVSFKLMVL